MTSGPLRFDIELTKICVEVAGKQLTVHIKFSKDVGYSSPTQMLRDGEALVQILKLNVIGACKLHS
jgi:hypothetical protein